MKNHAEQCPLSHGFQNCTCDGYHTFAELYEHRIVLFIALCWHIHDLYQIENPGKYKVWKSKQHSDGTMFHGMFIAGIGMAEGMQITYHLPISYWDETWFIEKLDKAPEFDGHSSEDVITRLKEHFPPYENN